METGFIAVINNCRASVTLFYQITRNCYCSQQQMLMLFNLSVAEGRLCYLTMWKEECNETTAYDLIICSILSSVLRSAQITQESRRKSGYLVSQVSFLIFRHQSHLTDKFCSWGQSCTWQLKGPPFFPVPSIKFFSKSSILFCMSNTESQFSFNCSKA